MAAYFDTGFSVRQPMWHGEGLVLDDYPTDWQDARVKAGLTWEPETRPVYQLPTTVGCEKCKAVLGTHHNRNCELGTIDELVTPGQTDPLAMRDGIVLVPRRKLIVRNDNEHVLGVVGEDFELVLHSKMGEILEALLGSNGGTLKFETAGSVREGAQVWALCYLDEPYTVKGDDTETYPFIVLLNAHDGSGACKLIVTQVRVVCWNTYRAAELEGERHGRQFTFRHTGTVNDRIDQAKAALAGVRDEAAEWDALSTELFGMKVDEAQFNHFLADFIPEPVGDVVSERVRNNVSKAHSMFKHLYLDSPTGEAHRGTALGLVDASVEYLDHLRGFRNADTYMGRTLLRPEPLKAKAVSLARQVCSA